MKWSGRSVVDRFISLGHGRRASMVMSWSLVFLCGSIAWAADGDGDGINDEVDNCPEVFNAGQENADQDEYGDACDTCPGLLNTEPHSAGIKLIQSFGGCEVRSANHIMPIQVPCEPKK